MKKLIYTLFLSCIFLFPIAITGCGQNTSELQKQIQQENAFRIIRTLNSQGQISLSYIFPVNTKKLAENGFSDEEIKAYKFYLVSYVNALAKSNEQKEVEGVEVSNCAYYTDVDGIGFTINFGNLQAQKKFFNVQDDGNNNDSMNKKYSGLFIRRMEIETTFPVSTKDTAEDLIKICTMSMSTWCQNSSIKEAVQTELLKIFDDSVFIYDYATQEKGLKSKTMYEDENFYHNVFIKSVNEIENDNKIVFYIEYINKSLWYLSALIIVVIGMGFALLIIKKRIRQTIFK